MIWVVLFVAQATAANRVLEQRGSEVFTRNCAVAYCHGPQGSAGRAPQLAGRRFGRFRLFGVINDGIPNTSMPGFKDQLSLEDLDAVVAYIMSLGKDAPSLADNKAAPAKVAAPPEEVKPGRELFFDPGRLASCGTCHLLDGWGVAVGPDVLAAKPKDIAELRAVSAKRVKTAHSAGEKPFPALPVDQTRGQLQVYDLTVSPPVLRTFLPAEVKVTEGTEWRHAAVTRSYSDEELRAILRYLGWLQSQ